MMYDTTCIARGWRSLQCHGGAQRTRSGECCLGKTGSALYRVRDEAAWLPA